MLIAFLTLGFLSQTSRFSYAMRGAVLQLPGYSYYAFANAWDYSHFSPCKTIEGCAKIYSEFMERINENDLHDFAKGFALRATDEKNRKELYEQYNRLKDNESAAVKNKNKEKERETRLLDP